MRVLLGDKNKRVNFNSVFTIFCVLTAVYCSAHTVLETGLGRLGEQPAALLCFVFSTEGTGNMQNLPFFHSDSGER